MSRFFSAILILAIVGCASRQAQLVGTWKAREVKPLSSSNLRDVAAASMMSLFASGMTLEFNREGKFKMSQALGWAEGTYKIEGSEVVLTFNTLAPQRPIRLVFEESKILALKTDFASDPTVKFDKQPRLTGSP